MDMFNLVAIIGRGHFWKVCVYEHCLTGELIAMKSISKARMIECHKVKYVMTERNILASARHPFIIGLKFAFQTPTKFCLGLEYASGGDLYRYRSLTGSLPVPEMKFYVAEIACALNYLHSIGVVYRDLKPENVLFDSDGHVKLADFGLSRELGEDETARTMCGTFEYLAPEMVLKRPYSFEVDWWALGILGYELIVGKTPFAEDGPQNSARICERIVNSVVSYEPVVDLEVETFLEQLLEKDPARRGGFEAIKASMLFGDTDWTVVERRCLTPPFVPPSEPLANFDVYESGTAELAPEEWNRSASLSPKVPGFSYTEESVLLEDDVPAQSPLCPVEMDE
jgi:serine/threonine protein kinase